MSGGGSQSQKEQQHMTASQLSKQYQSVLKPANKPEHEISQVTSTDDKYEVKLSIHEFEPHELSVKVVDRYVHVEGRHEEKNDKIGFFTRKFTRSYFLPEGAQPESVRCTFNIDTKLLTVTAPIVVKKPSKEYIIPVVIVGSQPARKGHDPLQTHSLGKEDKLPKTRDIQELLRDLPPPPVVTSVPKTPKKGKVPKVSDEKGKTKREPPSVDHPKTPVHSHGHKNGQSQTVHYAQIQHHLHHQHPPPPQATPHHTHPLLEGHNLPPPPPQHQHLPPQQRDHSHFHQHQHQLTQHQHQSRSEHHLTQVSRQHSQNPPGSECQHEPHQQQQQQQRSSSSSASAPTTANRPHRPKQQYPDHQEIDRLLLQQLMEQQARQRLHQQQQQQLFQMHQQQYQQQYQPPHQPHQHPQQQPK